MNPLTVVGLGEILWDFLPSGRQLGGAPANFAHSSHLLGDRSIVASRIGADGLGNDIRASLLRVGLAESSLQVDSSHPTGTVHVKLDSRGQPQYEITRSVAWDFMEWTKEWDALAHSADAVCFGSLAQRSEQSRSTILRFLDAMRPEAVRIFDVNLRQQFYSSEVIEESLRRANAVKVNKEESLILNRLLGLPNVEGGDATIAFCRELITRFDLHVVCVTDGADGSLLCDREARHRHPGFRVDVKDTVGSGDAFTAGMVHGYLRRQSLAEMNELANRIGAWVASCPGAMPLAQEFGLMHELMRLR